MNWDEEEAWEEDGMWMEDDVMWDMEFEMMEFEEDFPAPEPMIEYDMEDEYDDMEMDDGGGGGGGENDEEGGPEMEEAADDAPAEGEDASEEAQDADAESDEVETDFMQDIPENTRSYSHELREGWSKFSDRIDFTQTVLFVSS